jgi:hypothetical protein
MRLPDGRYLFGQVVLADLPADKAPMPRSNLIYIYRATSDTPDPDLSQLRPDNLLLPPIFTNRLAWSKGYFNTVAHRELSDGDLLPQHCFWRATTRRHVDVTGQPTDRRTEPCGDWGLAGYLLIDREISDALGIPRAPVSG